MWTLHMLYEIYCFSEATCLDSSQTSNKFVANSRIFFFWVALTFTFTRTASRLKPNIEEVQGVHYCDGTLLERAHSGCLAHMMGQHSRQRKRIQRTCCVCGRTGQ